MDNEINYFPHSYTAHEDVRYEKLINETGFEGYGIYWYLMELIASSDECRIFMNDIKEIAESIGVEYDYLKDIITKYDLFIVQGDYFWSTNIASFFQEKQTDAKNKKKDDFELFWKMYPVKKSKKPAWEKFQKTNVPIEQILSAIQNQIAEKLFLQQTGKFCPEWKLPNTWLHQECWNDEVEAYDITQLSDEDWMKMMGNPLFEVQMNKADKLRFAKLKFGI